MWRQNIVEEARSWKGTPYQHKGRIKGVGVDCGGLLHASYSTLMQLPPFPQNYPADWALHAEGPELYFDFIAPFVTEVSKPKPGGVALFKIAHRWAHGAISTERNTFVHAWGRNGEGGVVEWPLAKFAYGLGNGAKQRAVRYFDVKEELWVSLKS
jgi:cell wall-associated NlpC family hydrolase